MASLGGSSTAGHALWRGSPALFHALFFQHVNTSYPHAAHSRTNAGTPGTGPVYMDKCLRYELPHAAPDLVTIEYTQNNQYFADKVALERLLRRVLALPSAPAVVLISVPVWSQLQPCQAAEQKDCERERGRRRGIEEELVLPLASRYAVPHLSLAQLLEAHRGGILAPSLRGGAFADGTPLRRSFVNATAGWWQCHQRDRESVGMCAPPAPSASTQHAPHPNHLGHELIAQMLSYLLRSAATRGERRQQQQQQQAPSRPLEQPPELPLPAPMFTEAAAETADESCIGAEAMRGYVRRADGWTYEVEGSALHPKPGLIARTPGAALELCYPLRWPDSGGATTRLNIALGYLRSYDAAMGLARLECVGGCTCRPTLLEGRHASRTSVTFIMQLAVRQSLGKGLGQGTGRGAGRARLPPNRGLGGRGAESVARGHRGRSLAIAPVGGDMCPCLVRLTANTSAAGGNGGHGDRGAKFKVNLMLVYEDREAYAVRKTFISNGGFRQAYLKLPTESSGTNAKA